MNSMEEIVKHINDTNASYRKPNAGDAKNTDLFLDNEHYEMFKDLGEKITVRFDKDNLSKAILFIASILPRKYDNSGTHKTILYSSEFVYDQLEFLDHFFKEDGVPVVHKTQIWNARKDVLKKNGEIDSRFYFNNLLDTVDYVNSKGEYVSSKFTIRNYLAGGYSDLHIKKADDDIFDVWVTNALEPYYDDKDDEIQSTLNINEVELRDDYSLSELGAFLCTMASTYPTIDDFPGGMGAVCIAFGFKYGKSITKGNFLAKDLVDEANKNGANINHTQDGNINEGLHLYLLVEKGIFGLRFTKKPLPKIKSQIDFNHAQYLTAMRTKPFLLLAGISGTGKSRIVKEMAFASCPTSLRQDEVTPGNYCMIEVKPNWHDSTELMGYESKINGDHYVVTPFILFLIKAMHNPDVPFFVCLDEMNLAPVEQYFAEFLSVLESRKLINGEIVSEPLIKPEIFSKKDNFDSFKNAFFRDNLSDGNLIPEEFADLWKELGDNGLRLPPNVIVVGTVNMDETTYQFSRKVIDRAMTIEMNEVDFNSMFSDKSDTLQYQDPPVGAEYFLPKYAAAKDALSELSETDCDYLKAIVPAMLNSLDTALANTPFRIAYRVENELILYFAALREEQAEASAEALLATAVDDILMMKVLPRIEGNEDTLTEPLEKLAKFTKDNNFAKAHGKVEEMQARLEANHFTSFWP